MSSRDFEGPREVRLQIAAGDVLTVSHGAVPPALSLPFPNALREVAELLASKQAEKGDGWLTCHSSFHLSRGHRHTAEALTGLLFAPDDSGEDDLLHAAARLLMALEVRSAGR